SLRVPGAGSHKLQAWFSVRVDRPGELQFLVPRVAQGKLSLRVPGKTSFLQSLVHLGSQRVKEDDKGSLLEVDLGAVTLPGARRTDVGPAIPLQFRWSEGKSGKPAVVEFREAYVWDLGRRGYGLTGVVLFDIGPGTVERLSIDIPPSLIVKELAVSRGRREGERGDGDGGTVGLRDWRLTGGAKGPPQLQLDFQTPV